MSDAAEQIIGMHDEASGAVKAVPITRDDAATGKLLQSVLDIVAECDLAPEFAGFQIQEARTESGLLLYVRLVPCDSVGGIVSPRTV